MQRKANFDDFVLNGHPKGYAPNVSIYNTNFVCNNPSAHNLSNLRIKICTDQAVGTLIFSCSSASIGS
jgi:hypothetical protein